MRPTTRAASSIGVGPTRNVPPVVRLLHLCNGLVPSRDGGMVPSILGFAGALARAGEAPLLVTPTASQLEPGAVPGGVDLVGPEPQFADWVAKAELVHMHGLWQAHTRVGARAARRVRVPYVIAAHGMADPWALRHKAWKKRMYRLLVEGENLRRAACLHALSAPEVVHLRSLAPRTPIAWVPNGVSLEPFAHMPKRSRLSERHPELRGKFVVLFLGRLHRKKGLDLLAEAFAQLAPEQPQLHLLIAGRDEGCQPEFEARLAASRLNERVTWLGHVEGNRALEAWAAADAFVLPSYSEGFSMAVLEAMAARLPVLISTACHFSEVATRGAGLVVPPEAARVLAGLRQLIEMSPAERADMGHRARSLVEADYSWDRQAGKLREVYAWILERGAPPEAVLAAREVGG